MDLLFASPSVFNWEAEKNFERLKAERPDIAHSAAKGDLMVNPEKAEFNDPTISPSKA